MTSRQSHAPRDQRRGSITCCARNGAKGAILSSANAHLARAASGEGGDRGHDFGSAPVRTQPSVNGETEHYQPPH